MGLFDAIRRQLRSVIQWENPGEDQLFFRWSDNGDEIKNASKLIVGPGQGCLFVYEGKVRSAMEREGLFDLATSNIPFWTTLTRLMQSFESEHKVGIFFYRRADLLNKKWGTRSPVKYRDPEFDFPVSLKAFGNYSFRIADAREFFARVVAGQPAYSASDLSEILMSRLIHSLSDQLAESKLSYIHVDAHRDEIAAAALAKLQPQFAELGLELVDFRLEGTDFDAETKQRIDRIAGTVADREAAAKVGLDYAEFQKLEAMRDAARNESGGAGAGMGIGAGIGLGQYMSETMAMKGPGNQPRPVAARLQDLKSLLDQNLITPAEFEARKQEILREI